MTYSEEATHEGTPVSAEISYKKEYLRAVGQRVCPGRQAFYCVDRFARSRAVPEDTQKPEHPGKKKAEV